MGLHQSIFNPWNVATCNKHGLKCATMQKLTMILRSGRR